MQDNTKRLFLPIMALFSQTFTKMLMTSLPNDCKIRSNGVCLPLGYDKHQIPSIPITIHVSIDVLSITNVDDRLAVVDLLAYLSLKWEDSRLLRGYDHEIADTTGDPEWILLNKEWLKELWFPDLFIYGMKKTNLPKFLQDYEGKQNLNCCCFIEFFNSFHPKNDMNCSN